LNLLVRQAREHQAHHAHIHPGLAGGGQEFVVLLY
jgi:hypothetical protein